MKKMKISGHAVDVGWSLGGGTCLPMGSRTMFFSLSCTSSHQASDLVGSDYSTLFQSLFRRRRGDASLQAEVIPPPVCGRGGYDYLLIPGLGSVKLCPMKEGPPDWRIQELPPSPLIGARAQGWDRKYGH